jgi:hypothetical protein
MVDEERPRPPRGTTECKGIDSAARAESLGDTVAGARPTVADEAMGVLGAVRAEPTAAEVAAVTAAKVALETSGLTGVGRGATW